MMEEITARKSKKKKKDRTGLQTRSYKYRIYPSQSQAKRLDFILEALRLTWNELLAIRRDTWEKEHKSIGGYDCNYYLARCKKLQQGQWLKAVHSQTLQELSGRLDKAFAAFFRRCKNGEQPGYPRFKSKGRIKSIKYMQSGFSFINNERIEVSKVGAIKIKMHREIPRDAKILTLTLKKEADGKWYAIFETEKPSAAQSIPVEDSRPDIGIDLGVEDYITQEDGKKIKNPRNVKAWKEKIDAAESRRDQANAGTKTYERRRLRCGRLNRKLTHIRRDFQHKLSRALTNKYSAIYAERLQIQNMMEDNAQDERGGNHKNRNISDVGWGTFLGMLAYKAEEAGCRLVLVDPAGTTQRCSQCGTVVPKGLNDRWHHCPVCGFDAERDTNSAKEIGRIGRGLPYPVIAMSENILGNNMLEAGLGRESVIKGDNLALGALSL